MSLACEPWTWPQISKAADDLGYSAEKRKSELARAPERLGNSPDTPAASDSSDFLLWRDSFGWCPFCHQIQLHLEEKGVAYKVRRVPLSNYRVGEKDSDLLQDSPDGLVPALRVYEANSTGAWSVVRGADDVAKFIESTCSGPQLLRQPGVDLNMCKVNLSLADVLVKWVSRFTKAAVQAALETDDKSFQRSAKEAETWLMSILEDVEIVLRESGGPYIFGEVFSVVDMAFAPWIDRASAYLSFFSKVDIQDGRFPSLDAWSAAMAIRPAHCSLRLDRETLIRVAAINWAPAAMTASSHALQCWPSPWTCSSKELEQLAAAEAAQCLAACHEGVIALARHRAPESPVPLIDKLLRAAAVAALHGGTPLETGVSEEPRVRDDLAVAIIFIRSRIAVPRDMSEAAACCFRSLLQMLAEGLVGKQRVCSLLLENFYAYSEKINFLTAESKANL